MATFGERASAQSLTLDQAWELVSELECPEGKELIALSTWMKTQRLSPKVKQDLVEKVRVEILGWKPRESAESDQ